MINASFKVTILIFQILLFINILQGQMNVSQSKRKEGSSIKKYQNSIEIDVLYHEFQSLKSQIYGVKRQIKSQPVDTHWSNKNSKEKAMEMLRESTIHKQQQQLQENLAVIQGNQPKIKKGLFKKNSQQPPQPNDYIPSLTVAFDERRHLSKQLKEYSEQASLNLEDLVRHSIKEEGIHFAQGEEIFRQFLTNNKRFNPPSQLSASRREQSAQLISRIQLTISSLTEDHLKKLNFLFETLTFMSRKLQCLELIIQEYGKILKAKNQQRMNQQTQQNQLIINVQAIEKRYELQMKKMKEHYQQESKKTTLKYKQNQPKNTPSLKSQDINLLKILKEENQRLADLLQQAKDLISTKEEFITSLSEQNQDLRSQLQRLKKPNQIRGSADSSLGYSVTADKYPKKEGSQQMMHIAQRLNMALENHKKKDWDEFEEGSDNDINYSQLDSVKDKSIDDWDISHLEIRRNSNAKSIEDDCLKIMANKRPKNDEQNC